MSRNRRRGPRPALPSSANPHSAALRAAGLRVTSARLAALRLAPDLLQRHGRLDAQMLHAACHDQGYTVSIAALYQVLPNLIAAGLLPAQATATQAERATADSPGNPDDDHTC